MMAFIWALVTTVISIIADTLAIIDKCFRPKDIKALFDKKNEYFNLRMEDIVKDVLINGNPQIKKHLLTADIDGEFCCFPVIGLKKGDWDKGNFKDAVNVHSFLLAETVDDSVKDDKFISFLGEIGRRVYECPTFRLLDITHENDLIFGRSTYFKTLCATDKLLYEMIRRFPLSGSKIRKLLYKQDKVFLSWKNIVNKVINNHSFYHYSASVGCAVLTVLRDNTRDKDNPEYIYLVNTSTREKNSVFDRHVIPSFMFEPVSDSFREQEKELNVEVQVLREFGEEILGMEELANAKFFAALEANIEKNETLGSLRRMLAQGSAKLAVTGLCLDLFRLRPEITCVLIIDDPCFYEKYRSDFVFNWETKRMDTFKLFDDRAYNSLLMDKEKRLCSPGAAALIYGREYAIKFLENKICLSPARNS